MMGGKSERRRTAILVVSPRELDHASIERIFEGSNWQVLAAACASQAVSMLRQGHIGVVICDCDTDDCDWRRFVEETKRLPGAAVVILASRVADDELWLEVLEHGAFDLLAKPFNARDVVSSVSLAWRRRMDQVGTLGRS